MGDEAPNLADLKLHGGRGKGRKKVRKKKKKEIVLQEERVQLQGSVTHGKNINFHRVTLKTTADEFTPIHYPWVEHENHSPYNSVFEETESTRFTSCFPGAFS